MAHALKIELKHFIVYAHTSYFEITLKSAQVTHHLYCEKGGIIFIVRSGSFRFLLTQCTEHKLNVSCV